MSSSSHAESAKTIARMPDAAMRPVLGWLPKDAVVRPWQGTGPREALARVARAVYVVGLDGALGYALGAPEGDIPLDFPSKGGFGAAAREDARPPATGFVACAAACLLEHLGDPGFGRDHGVRYAYYGGSMANAIASVEMVEALARHGFLGFFGAAGLPLAAVEAAIDRLSASLKELPYGFNLIHSPNEPYLEAALADLYIRRRIHLIEASAYLDLTLPVVRYRVHGIHRDASGAIVTPNRVVAKVSRVEVASKFLAPPPQAFLEQLIDDGAITAEQAELAGQIPMAQDLTAEADSGGHTDNRPALTLLPTMLALAQRMQQQHGYAQRVRVGLAGGISTPASAAAAFSMGAAYIVTGSINQACIESGSSNDVRLMLAETKQADITMAPAADMFEMGVEVQVLKRGTMFAMRGAKLYELYKNYDTLDALPEVERTKLEKTVFRAPLETVWAQTRGFFLDRDPKQVTRAESDPKHKMALVFRSYLGQASGWANAGLSERKIDYQIWCGPAMGAFNEWVRGTFLADPCNRKVAVAGLNILYGAAVLMRCGMLRSQGVPVPSEAAHVVPLELDQLKEFLH